MDGTGEDLFFLSNGHISPVWYSVLARSGYFNVSELATFRKLNSRLQGHPATEEGLPGIRIASGSLGQGLSAACGAAQTKKLNDDDNLVYVLMGDGELQEGQVWEAAMYAPHHNIDNLIASVDFNGQQIDGPTEKVMSLLDLKAKWQAFGWEVIESNGNDMKELIAALNLAKSLTGLTLGEDGATHQILEDIGMMKMLPNMTVINPCDYNQTKAATIAIADHHGPVYLRFGRPKVPIFTPADQKFEIGKALKLIEGSDVSIFATGHLVWEAIEAEAILAEEGIKAEVINIHTIKPLDIEAILQSVAKTGCAVSAEEH
ncbi:UNVERIFIED_CONTAM: hypothetical protein GTU68_011881, partial [Idotea baltica]|nr:hypothetical protein [Idotea baltica]